MTGLARRSWFTLTLTGLALVAGLTLAALAVLGAPEGAGIARAAAATKLTAFGSCDRLAGYLRRHADQATGPIAAMPFEVAEDTALSAPGAAEAPPAPPSSTNLQEAGVDEPDLVKVAGETLFALGANRLRTVATGEGVPAVLDSLELPGGPGVAYADDRELLVAGDRALVISRTYAGWEGAYAPRTLLTELDISDPTALRELATMTVEGSYVSARLTGSTVRVAIGAYPQSPVADRGNGRAWMPSAVLRDAAEGRSRGSLVGCEDVRRPRRFSGTTMLSVLTIDLDRGLPAVDTDAVMTGAETVYASSSALYVATERWVDASVAGDLPSQVTTAIHRFDTSDPERTTYTGSGSVEGYMLSQWSMSEHDGVLRVASTSAPSWAPGGGAEETESYITTLAPTGKRLVEVGRLDGIGRGERIYAVRFIGPTGYVVTFRQVDPLHVIDLADPAAPRLAGELEIPGYSAYLHPVGPGLLLGIGQDAGRDGVTTGAQASLFDVSDPARPVRTDHVSLGRGATSEVEGDHHAFTWIAEHGLAVVPIGSWSGRGLHGAVGVRVGSGGLELTARTAHGAAPEAAIRRTVVIGGLPYTVSARGVAAHEPATLERLALTPFAGGD